MSIKKDLQSYKAQSPIQKEIFYLTEITFQKLQWTTRLDYNAYFPGFVISQISMNGMRSGWAAIEKAASVITMPKIR